jgi:hypothetical protein
MRSSKHRVARATTIGLAVVLTTVLVAILSRRGEQVAMIE